MARLRDVVFDCRKPAPLARFCASALDGYAVAPYDAELERLRGIGIDDPEDDPSVLVEPSDRGPRLFFTLVPEPKVAKNRVHLDVHADDMEAELERLSGLGATVLTKYGDGHVLLADPEGNEFCLMP